MSNVNDDHDLHYCQTPGQLVRRANRQSPNTGAHWLWWAVIIAALTILAALPYECLAVGRKVQYVDRDVSGGTGDGSSWANAYQTMFLAEAQDSNLVAADKYLEMYYKATKGTDDTVSVVWSGWGTDETHTIKLIQDPNTYHDGAWNAGCYTLVCQNDKHAMTINQSNLTVDGLQIDGLGTGLKYGGILVGPASRVTIRNNLIRGFTGTNHYGILFNYGTVEVERYAYNNIIFENYTGMRIWRCQAFAANNTFANNTCAGLEIVRAGSLYILNATVQNNLMTGSGTADYATVFSGGTLTLGCNYTGDATSPDGFDKRNIDVNFVDAAGDNFTLHTDMAAYIDDCTDQSAVFTVDINDLTRTHWDAGAFETIEGYEPPAPPVPSTPTAYYVDPVDGLDPVKDGIIWVDQVDANEVTHDGLTRAGAWKTVKYAVFTGVPDLNGGATLYLVEGDYGAITLQQLAAGGYQNRSQYVTITPDPNNVGQAVIRQLSGGDKTVPYFLRWDHCLFQDGGSETLLRNPGSVRTWLISLTAVNYMQFVDCNMIGVIGHVEGDVRKHSKMTTCYGIFVNHAGSPGTASNVLIQRCTIKRLWSGIQFYLTRMGPNFQALDNKISECGVYALQSIQEPDASRRTLTEDQPSTWPLVQGNYIHGQAQLWYSMTGDELAYSARQHGSGLCPSSGFVRYNANTIVSYGSTAAIRNYPGSGPGVPMKTLYLTNNLVVHGLNYGMDLFNLASGSKVLHNTIIGIHKTEAGRYYFRGSSSYVGGIHAQYYNLDQSTIDTSDVQICNNVVVSWCAAPPANTTYKIKGNLFWGVAGYSDTSFNAAYPGNKLYCSSLAVYPAVDDDSNSVTFTTPGAFFNGGGGFASAYNDYYVDANYIYQTIDDPPAPTHEFDLVEKADAVGFGDPNYTTATDFWGSARVGLPDAGFDESPPDPTPEDDEPNPPAPAIVKPKWMFIRKGQ